MLTTKFTRFQPWFGFVRRQFQTTLMTLQVSRIALGIWFLTRLKCNQMLYILKRSENSYSTDLFLWNCPDCKDPVGLHGIDIDGTTLSYRTDVYRKSIWGPLLSGDRFNIEMLFYREEFPLYCWDGLHYIVETVPGRVLTLWRWLHMLRHFDPPFSGLWKICIVSTPIFEQKLGKCRISTPIFCQNLAKCIVSTPLFGPL